MRRTKMTAEAASRAAPVCRRSTGMLRQLSRLALLAFAAGALCGAAVAEVRNPNGVAVIIGNKEYRSPDVPPVAYAHRDAEAFKHYVIEVLGFDPDNVFELRDADRGEMFKAFGRRGGTMSDLWAGLARLPEGGDVVVYYSGHGVPGREGGKGYLLPVNVPPRAAQEDGYPLDLLYEKLGALDKARSVQVFLDACFSGGSHAGFLVQGASPVAMSAAMPMEAAVKVTVLTAAQGSQLASWDEEAEHGLFTHHLLDALYGKGDSNRDGRVTANEARAYLDAHMSAAAWLAHGREQKAVLLKTAGAEVVLASAVGDGFPARPDLDRAAGSGPEEKKEPEAAQAPEVEPVVSSLPPPAGHATAEEALGLDRDARMLVQRSLDSLGFDAGPVDGAFGPKTRGAIGAWQEAKGYDETGYLTEEQAEVLKAFGREAERRAEAERKAREEAEARREREERKREDDEAFASAKGLGTVAAFDGYLSSCGAGCGHGAEARRLRAEAAERERFQPGKRFRDCEGCPWMVVVPEGSFLMGSPESEAGRYGDEGPVHEVTIGYRLAVGVYEVTFGEWEACVSDRGCGGYRPDDEGWGRGRRPVMNVSWDDAQAYVRWLSGETGEEYRLLSEAEWEYVARAGTETARYWGESESGQCRYANGADRTAKRHRSGWTTVDCDDGHYQTSLVGRFQANGYELHDVLGNVWEWVEDCWNESYVGAPRDGSAWTSGECGRRVLRGGSWDDSPRYLRSAYRGRGTTGGRIIIAGFRVARTLTP